jgi:hypothetical protein
MTLRSILTGLILFASAMAQGPVYYSGADTVNTIKNASYCPDTSLVANTITCQTAIGFAGYLPGQTVDVLLANTVSGATTIGINGLAGGPKAVTYNGANPLTSAIGWIAGATARLTFDGTRFVMQGIVGASGGPGNVVAVGNLTPNAIVTGAGPQAIQTPSPTSTLDSNGNEVLAGSLTVGGGTPPPLPAGAGSCVFLGKPNYTAWCVPTVLNQQLALFFLNAVPSANQVLLFGATAGGESQGVFTTFLSTNLTDSASISRIIASGTSALGTSAIAGNSCATVVTTIATGTASTDSISWSPNADISGVTGYGVASTDGLKVYPYPTTNNVNWRVCNGTGSSITPGAVTLNWRVTR